jgi:predicted small secreted protein
MEKTMILGMRESAARLLLGLFLFGAMAGALGACNTTRGLGQDIKSGGQTIENGAEDVQKKL